MGVARRDDIRCISANRGLPTRPISAASRPPPPPVESLLLWICRTVKPPTVTLGLLDEKFERAAETSVTNYSFYFGATNENAAEIERIDPKWVCGVKVFMGSSTGNMLVDDDRALASIFAQSPVPVATHCEDEASVRANMERFRAGYGDEITVAMHPLIRSARLVTGRRRRPSNWRRATGRTCTCCT